MDDSEGKFGQPLPQSWCQCPKCKRYNSVSAQIWESNCGGYEDIKYSCECGHTWWVEGIDS